MVWNAATFWAETSEGSDRKLWEEELHRAGTPSACTPQRLKKLQDRRSPKRAKSTTPAHAAKNTSVVVVNRDPRLTDESTPLGRRNNSLPPLASSAKRTTSAFVQGSPNVRQQQALPEHSQQQQQQQRSPPPLLSSMSVQAGAEHEPQECSDPDQDVEEHQTFLSEVQGGGYDDQSPFPIGEEGSSDPLPDIHGARPKRTMSEVSRQRRARIADLRQNRVALFHERNQKLQEHTQEVQRRGEEFRSKKEHATLEIMERKRRRLLDPIDRCMNDEERNELRAYTYSTILQHVQLVRTVEQILNRQKAVRLLRSLMYPIAYRRSYHRKRVGSAWAAVWLEKTKRPTVAELQEMLPPLLFWPPESVIKVQRVLKPQRLVPNEFLAHEAEPCSCAYLMTGGKISIRQRAGANLKGKEHSREIGDRRGRAVFGEEAILKAYRTKHMANLICTELAYVWELSRKDFQRIAVTVPAAASALTSAQTGHSEQTPNASGEVGAPGVKTLEAESGDIGKLMAAAAASSGAPASSSDADSDAAKNTSASPSSALTFIIQGQVMYPLQPTQIRDNRCFTFWSNEDLQNLLALCTYRSYSRGSYIYRVGEKSDKLFIVWKGTVEVATATGVLGMHALKKRIDRIRKKEPGGGGLGKVAPEPAVVDGSNHNPEPFALASKQSEDHSKPIGSESFEDLMKSFSSGQDEGDGQPTAQRMTVSQQAFAEDLDAERPPIPLGGDRYRHRSTAAAGGDIHGVGAGSSHHTSPAHSMSVPKAASSRRRALNEERAFTPAVARRYANVGQVFGEDGVLFRMAREGVAQAATDVLVYEVPSYPFIDGCLSSASAFYEYMCTLNVQRAHRLQRPPSAVYEGLLLPSVIPVFQKHCHAMVTMKGEEIPLNSNIIFLQQGLVQYDGKLYEAPAMLLSAEALENAMDWNAATQAELQSQLGPGVAKEALSAAFEMKSAVAQLPKIGSRTKSMSRVDMWAMELDLLLRRLPKIAKVSDVLVSLKADNLVKKHSGRFGNQRSIKGATSSGAK
jgi:CRP-like cAMP-binding protein